MLINVHARLVLLRNILQRNKITSQELLWALRNLDRIESLVITEVPASLNKYPRKLKNPKIESIWGKSRISSENLFIKTIVCPL